jgi:Fe-S cluster biogenesis protein NfuA
MRDKIQKFIDDDINPALAQHGGFISIDRYDDEHKHLYLRLGGGCQGCAASTITLKLQVRTFLLEEFPDLKEIEDVTDHDAGTNPYYTQE